MRGIRRSKRSKVRGIEFCDSAAALCSEARRADRRLEGYKTEAWIAGVRRSF